MQNIENKQFKLTDEGIVLFQKDASNPLPGTPVGTIAKGGSIAMPVITATGDNLPAGIDQAALQDRLDKWIKDHIFDVLNPLMVLTDEEDIQAPAREIATRLYNAFGILPREDLEDQIALLDETGRAALRQRKVRLGPVLVFLPLLNKPAAVRLRALLWHLWADKSLPAPTPHDGITSVAVDKTVADPVYYRAIGYPLYGSRAIRVDMLDRVISAVYDSADKGVFKARHEMAEWLGCPIADLYDVLEAMGHTKIHDPADTLPSTASDSPKDTPPPLAPSGDGSEVETPIAAENSTATNTVAPDIITSGTTVPDTKNPDTGNADTGNPDIENPNIKSEEAGKPQTANAPEAAAHNSATPEITQDTAAAPPQIKPELATFRLRRGKAYGSGQRKPYTKPEFKRDNDKNFGDKNFGDRKFGNKPNKNKDDSKKPFNKKKKAHNPKDGGEKRDRIVSAPAKKIEASPFAVLKELQRK